MNSKVLFYLVGVVGVIVALFVIVEDYSLEENIYTSTSFLSSSTSFGFSSLSSSSNMRNNIEIFYEKKKGSFLPSSREYEEEERYMERGEEYRYFSSGKVVKSEKPYDLRRSSSSLQVSLYEKKKFEKIEKHSTSSPSSSKNVLPVPDNFPPEIYPSYLAPGEEIPPPPPLD
jgi:hypothetical protein